jgi:hypothetical protein
MTVETKTTIQPSDIITVEFECKKCHSLRTWPIAVARHPPVACNCCEADDQWMTTGGDVYAALTDLIALLQRFGKAQNEPFAIRLGVKNAIASDRAIVS